MSVSSDVVPALLLKLLRNDNVDYLLLPGQQLRDDVAPGNAALQQYRADVAGLQDHP